MSGNSTDEGQFSLDDSSSQDTPLTLETRTVSIPFDVREREGLHPHYSEKQFTLTLCIFQSPTYPSRFDTLSPAFLFPFYVYSAHNRWTERERERGTRERFRDRSPPHTAPFLEQCGKSSEHAKLCGGREEGERKCINAARNVRDDEVAVYTLYRMHEIFGSRESPLLRHGKVYESPWKLTFFMDRNGPRKPRYIRAQPRLTSC